MNNKFLTDDAKSSGFLYSVMMIAFVLISFLSQVVLSLVLNPKGTAYMIINQCVSSGVIFALIIFAKFSGVYKMPTFNKKGFVIGAPLAILLFLGMFMGLGFVNNLIAGWLQSAGLVVNGTSVVLSTPWHLICYIIALAILPAVSEEIFFRGILLKGLNKTKPVSAILLVSLCFGFYHMSLSKLIYQFIFGVLLCLLYMVTESLISCIVAHFVNNFTVLLSMYFKIYVDLNNIFVIIIGLVLLAGFIAIVSILLAKKYKNKEKTDEIKVDTKAETGKFCIFAGFGLIVSLVVMIVSLLPV